MRCRNLNEYQRQSCPHHWWVIRRQVAGRENCQAGGTVVVFTLENLKNVANDTGDPS